MEKIKVRKQAKKHIYVHNDLSNAAYHFNKRVNERLANNDREGIAFDILAGTHILSLYDRGENKLSGE